MRKIQNKHGQWIPVPTVDVEEEMAREDRERKRRLGLAVPDEKPLAPVHVLPGETKSQALTRMLRDAAKVTL